MKLWMVTHLLISSSILTCLASWIFDGRNHFLLCLLRVSNIDRIVIDIYVVDPPTSTAFTGNYLTTNLDYQFR